ncbi:MAG: zinc-ribbon domain-containing protein [Nitrososphaera sp.]
MDGTVGVTQDGASIKYCVECGARVPKGQKACPACGEAQ